MSLKYIENLLLHQDICARGQLIEFESSGIILKLNNTLLWLKSNHFSVFHV
jgi:hypothetical protein